MTTQTLSALYDRYPDAEAAVTKLEAAGVPHADISLVSNKANTGTGTAGGAGDHAATGAGTGATLGSLLGGGAGLLAGLGLMAIPGIGPVVAAGWLITTLTGAGIGAAAGGLAGSLTGAGVSETDAHAYAEGVRRGGTLLTVKSDEAHAGTVMGILDEHGAIDLDECAESWTRDGWTGSAAGGTRTDTATLVGSDAAAGSSARANSDLSGSASVTDAPLSGARRVRVYNHPV